MKLNIAHMSRRLCSSSPSSFSFKGIWQGCLAAWDFPTPGDSVFSSVVYKLLHHLPLQVSLSKAFGRDAWLRGTFRLQVTVYFLQ